jgi:hypothetical protein
MTEALFSQPAFDNRNLVSFHKQYIFSRGHLDHQIDVRSQPVSWEEEVADEIPGPFWIR